MNIKIVAFHTDDIVYSTYARLFKMSLQRLNVDYHIEVISREDGKWRKYANYKFTFLSRLLDETSSDLLLIDVDSFVHKQPTLYLDTLDADVAACKITNDGMEEVLTGTLFLRNNDKVKRLISDCNEILAQDIENARQQEVFLRLIENSEYAIKFETLPYEYTYIFDRTEIVSACDEPIIEHLQASREMRYLMESKKSLKRFLGIKSKKRRGLLRSRKRFLQLAELLGFELVSIFDIADVKWPLGEA